MKGMRKGSEVENGGMSSSFLEGEYQCRYIYTIAWKIKFMMRGI